MACESLHNLIKKILLLINFLLFVLGAVMLGFGIWCVVDDNMKIHFIDRQTDASVKIIMYIFFAVGGLTMIMGFVGCWGVVKESPFLLGLYFVIVLFIMITMVIAATFIFLFSGSDTGKIFLGVCIGGIIIEITGIILSVYLCQNIKIGTRNI